MDIRGLQKLSMVDYPGKLAATVFTGGCNLRCPFCHNALLVTRLSESPKIPQQEVLDFLSRRKGLLDGVVLSGGEPLLQPDAGDFLGNVKAMGFSIKLDTNGCYPDGLENLLSLGLVDYVAMDIKNAPGKYAKTVGLAHFDMAPIERSVSLLRESGIDYEFRTTLVHPFHTEEDLLAIGRWLEGSSRYVLQNFRDSGNLIGSGLSGFDGDALQRFLAIVTPFFQEAFLRGASDI